LIEAYLVDHTEAKRKASTAAWYRHGLERVVKSAFGAMKPDKVTRRDIAGLHSSLRDTPAQANRVLARIGTLYSWAAKAGYVPEGSDCRDGERVELHPPFFSFWSAS
jgi:hypothetical protein